MRCMRRWALAALVFFGIAPAQQKTQRMEAPKWLDDDGKELFSDIESDENLYGDWVDLTCGLQS